VLCAGEAGNIWSFNYFLYNRKQKRVLYFSCRGVSKTAGTDWRESSCCKTAVSSSACPCNDTFEMFHGIQPDLTAQCCVLLRWLLLPLPNVPTGAFPVPLQHRTSPPTTSTARTTTAMCATAWPPTWTCERCGAAAIALGRL